jgi:molybdopterin biosynthesis enzyme MoaB
MAADESDKSGMTIDKWFEQFRMLKATKVPDDANKIETLLERQSHQMFNLATIVKSIIDQK